MDPLRVVHTLSILFKYPRWGQQTRDPLFITDAIHAYIRAAERLHDIAGRAIPIGGGREQSIADIARLFLRCADKSTVPVIDHPERIRLGDMLRSYCDNLDATQALEWTPATSREKGLKQTFEYHDALSRSETEGHAFLAKWFESDPTPDIESANTESPMPCNSKTSE